MPYLPDASRNTGTGVVIAPGGGFVMLSYDSEGVEVAKWLAERGIAAFVLKYRVRQTDPTQSPMAAIKAADEPASNYDLGLADGAAAVKMIRTRAAEYDIKPDKIVMLGFSAGAIVTVQPRCRATSPRVRTMRRRFMEHPSAVSPNSHKDCRRSSWPSRKTITAPADWWIGFTPRCSRRDTGQSCIASSPVAMASA